MLFSFSKQLFTKRFKIKIIIAPVMFSFLKFNIFHLKPGKCSKKKLVAPRALKIIFSRAARSLFKRHHRHSVSTVSPSMVNNFKKGNLRWRAKMPKMQINLNLFQRYISRKMQFLYRLRHLETNSVISAVIVLPIPYFFFYCFLINSSQFWAGLLLEFHSYYRNA